MAEPLQQTMAARPSSSFDQVVRLWWSALETRRGDRAELRRARGTTAIAFLPAYHRLLRDLKVEGLGVPGENVAVIAGVLAHVERDVGSLSFGALMAQGGREGKARVSGLRFRRLLAVDDRNELLTALVRMVHLLDGQAPVSDLAASIRWWNDRTRKRWASDYYAVAADED